MSSFLVLTPPHRCNGQLAIAAARAGETGVVDLGYADDKQVQYSVVQNVARHSGTHGTQWGVRWDVWSDSSHDLAPLKSLPSHPWPLLVLAGIDSTHDVLRESLSHAREIARKTFLEVHTLDQALEAERAGFDGVIVKGHEAAGRISQESTFILLQRFHRQLKIPYFAQGGIAPDTAAAAFLSGASGVVLCEQLWLAVESPFDRSERRTWSCLDGSETVVVGNTEASYRFFGRANRDLLHDLERASTDGAEWQEMVRANLASDGQGPAPFKNQRNGLIPLSSDITFAKPLAERHINVAGILRAFKNRVEANLLAASNDLALKPGGQLAGEFGTQYPILQGPMTRVSDVAPFCRSVADNGALPFLALALMRAGDVKALLEETRTQLGKRPWGVGILGFVPAELRKEQLEVIREVRPPFAIIAGGRPSQAQQLEERGISTFLHVPSPGLLDSFIRDGSRKFIFEGRECGGHVGPRSSFVLWQSAMDVLASVETDRPDEFHIVFAGGIHDSLSAAMVATLAAPLTARGMKIGVLMGSAYLFTDESVEHSAILEGFQRRAIECQETVLLKTGVGHQSRCVKTPFSDEFEQARRRLLRSGKDADEIGLELEKLNLGRLRIAAKGLSRTSDSTNSDEKGDLVHTTAEEQLQRGMYMIGQVAVLRERTVSMATLHEDVSRRGSELLRKLAARKLPWQQVSRRRKKKRDDIAIVGVAGMFPLARNVRQFWENIVNRVNSIREVPPDRWRTQDFFSDDRREANRIYSKWGGFLGDVVFDPMKWLIPPASMPSIDPTQLLALEVANEALKDAGFDHQSICHERTGVVFASAGAPDIEIGYVFRTMLRHYLPKVNTITPEVSQMLVRALEGVLPEWTEDSFPGYLRNVISGRIANRLNLGGPNYVVDAACASSLTAVHTAVEHLRSGISDAMVVGAADITNHPVCYMSFAQTRALSPSGRPRPFDADADGIALGECIAAIVLKRLPDAVRDGNRIYAVIKGVGASSDGRNRGLTAPDPHGQMMALKRAYDDAGLSPNSISLIEAHGTGTSVGDMSEITSLNQFFSTAGCKPRQTAIGSIKSMIGHTKSAAGLASLVKTALALDQQVLPPTIGVDKPNALLATADSPLYVNSATRPWFNELSDHPRRAGVNSFGFGGTNFHVVLEEYTGKYHSHYDIDLTPRSAEILFWNRSSREEIIQSLRDLEMRLVDTDTDDLAQLASNVCAGSNTSDHAPTSCRFGLVAHSVNDLRKKLKHTLQLLPHRREFSDAEGIYYSEREPVETAQVCFLYPGQGSQGVNMLGELIVSSRWSRELFALADREFKDRLPRPLTSYIFPPPAFGNEQRRRQQKELNDTRVAQPALGVVELFATELLNRFGIRPGIAAGHSYGEYVALWSAGCLSQADLLRLSIERGRIAAEAGQTSSGTMAAVAAGAERTLSALKQFNLDVHLANVNAPNQTIIAGPVESIELAIDHLSKLGLSARKIPVTAAFHTPVMALAAKQLADFLAKIPFHKPSLPLSSNTTAERYPDDVDAIRQLLARHIAEPVQFENQIRRLRAEGVSLFLEVGPGCILSRLVESILGEDNNCEALPLDKPDRSGWTQLAHVLARIASLGLPVDLDTWFEARGLVDQTLDEFSHRADASRKRKPTDWIVTNARAVPASVASQSVTQSAVSPDAEGKKQPLLDANQSKQSGHVEHTDRRVVPTSAKQLPAVAQQQPVATSNITLPEEKMISSDETSRMSESERVAYVPQADLLPQIQNTISQWLELQKSQHSLMERLLDIQERLMCGTAHLKAESSPRPATVVPTANMTPVQPSPARTVSRPSIPIPLEPSAPILPRIIVPEAPRGAGSVQSIEPSSATRSGTPAAAESAAVEAPPPSQESVAFSKAVDENGVPTVEGFRRDLLKAVSDRTGYPVDVLDEEMPLEAGLGIDSIKTVEIFSNLKPYHVYFRAVDEDDEDMLLEFSQLKTLRAIVEAFDQRRKRFLPQESTEVRSSVSDNGSSGSRARKNSDEVQRYSVTAEAAPAEASPVEKKNSRKSTSS